MAAARSSVRASRFAVALTLIAVAGWVDAVGYLEFAQLFVSFMSGSSTLLGIDLGQGLWTLALGPLLAVGSFVLGAFLATLLGAAVGAWRSPVILAFETALLAIGMALPVTGDPAPAILPLALAMGAQNAVLHGIGSMSVGLTFITGSLVRLGQNAAEAVLGVASERWLWGLYACMWLGLIAGAIGGAAAHARFGFDALIAPTVALACLCLTEAVRTFIRKRRRR